MSLSTNEKEQLVDLMQRAIYDNAIHPAWSIDRAKAQLCTEVQAVRKAVLDYNVVAYAIPKFHAILKYASRNQKWPALRVTTPHGNLLKFTYNTAKDRINISNGLALSNPDNEYYGSISDKGTQFRTRSAAIQKRIQQTIVSYVKDPTAFAKIQGQHTGKCCFCAKELTKQTSIDYGYGAICADNYGLPYSEAKTNEMQTELELTK